ncbi:hypothetical protein KW782_00920 [Candidatus Parcubacteria bacterium]|nr:hypothetical protein [Candidatus Parcubacteria bacterium]
MTLATHAVTGALIGAVASQNLLFAAGAGFISHFLFDTIPHWDYSLRTLEKKSLSIENNMNTKGLNFIIDLAKIAFDFWLGMALVFVMVYSLPLPVIIGAFIGALAAVLPDPLQFVYWKLRPRIMLPIQHFHMYMHATHKLNDRPLLGVTSQLGIVIITFIVFQLIY